MGLLSFTPSRIRFPWGFLWDDGFHCEVAARSHPRLALAVVKSWLDTMQPNGWIPREQNRGADRERLCACERFMAKDLHDGNPPTLLLALDYLHRRGQLSPSNFPLTYWNRLRKWYSWFNETLSVEPYLYKWSDSIQQPSASFTSGMDDFPRPYVSAANIDLQAWLYFFASFMAKAAPLFDSSAPLYSKDSDSILAKLSRFENPTSHRLLDLDLGGGWSKEFGYPSILPLAFGMLSSDSLSYQATIAAVREELDTGNGLSSLSKLSSHYLDSVSAYWRGPVWININYLFLRGLRLHYPNETLLYKKLRDDLLSTVCGSYTITG